MSTISSQIAKASPDPIAPISEKTNKLGIYYVLFFLSGFPALTYQIVWQRALFTLYGVNIESVTIIVTVFMLGLGLGSLAGGWLSTQPRVLLLPAFGIIELSVGIFGSASLWIFHRVASFTAGSSTFATGVTAFALLLVPTLLMGSTLPLLVEHFVRITGNVGESVGSLYSVNTLGSGVACLLAALFIMRVLGESGSVGLAVSLNVIVGTAALLLHVRFGSAAPTRPLENSAVFEPQQNIPFWIAMVLAGSVGFISLAYEIIWYRLYSFTSGGAAPCFALLLAYYLFGIAYGSLAVRDVCRKKLKHDLRRTLQAGANVVILGTIAAFLLGPMLARSVIYVPYPPTFVFVFIAAALLGAAFPILSHAAIDPSQAAGSKISYLYLSNIVGSALGSFIIGFIVMDHWSTRVASLALLGLGLIIASIFAALARPVRWKSVFAFGSAACVALALFSGPLFSNMYERLLFKGHYNSSLQFADLVENRSGVIAVDKEGTVYGGGVYDGKFNTNLVHDTNGLFRAYAMEGLDAQPKRVLIIGLSSGSWAQVVANDRAVDDITVVEINPGYLPLIRRRPMVSSLLRNPKVHIIIDDGRRWLVAHPDRKFDFILMNTSFNWRANVSNLLSTEFLRLMRAHLNPGGIAYYNTTGSQEALITGAKEFPHALRISGFLAVSDSPFALDRARWETALTNDTMEGRPVFDLANPANQGSLQWILGLAGEPGRKSGLIESRASLLNRLGSYRKITDDNMGTEWR